MTNLLSNAFKYTPAGGRVILRARATTELVAIEVEDACGGIPEGRGDLFTPFGERRARNRYRTRPGAVDRAKGRQGAGRRHHVRNKPGKGCTFVIQVPAVTDLTPLPAGEPVP